MHPHPAITETAALIADPARATMLTALLDGRAYPAGELAFAAGVTPQTGSSHLAKLLAGGLVAVEAQGRHRYYRLADARVARMLEHLAAFGPVRPPRRRAPDPRAERLKFARCCYDHLAGSLGVAIARAMVARGYLRSGEGRAFAVTRAGRAWFARLGLDPASLARGRGAPAYRCLDWTEREPHLAGPIGTWFLRQGCAHGWFRRPAASRAVEVTPKGWTELRAHLGIDRRSIAMPPPPAPCRASRPAGSIGGGSPARAARIAVEGSAGAEHAVDRDR